MSTPTPIPTSPTGSAAPAGPQGAPAAGSAPNGLFNQLFAATVAPAPAANPVASVAGNQSGKTLPHTGKVLPFSAVFASASALEQGAVPAQSTLPATTGDGGVLGLMQQILNAAPEAPVAVPGLAAGDVAVQTTVTPASVNAANANAVAPETTPAVVVGDYLPAPATPAAPELSLLAQHTVAASHTVPPAVGVITETARDLRQQLAPQFKPQPAPGQQRTGVAQPAVPVVSEAMPGQTRAMPVNAAGAALAGKLTAETGVEKFAVQLRDVAAAGSQLTSSGGVIDTSLARADLRGLGLLSNAANVAPNPLPSLHSDTLSTERWSRAMGERVMWMVNAGNHKATIQLHPAELGQIELRVSMAQQHASVEITAQQASTREMLEQMSPRLATALEASGIKLDDLKVQAEDAGRQNGRNAQSGEGQLAQSERDDASARGGQQGAAMGEHGGAAEPQPDITGMSLLNVRSIDLYA